MVGVCPICGPNIADYPSRLKWQETRDALLAEYPNSQISYFSDSLDWPSDAWDIPTTFECHSPHLTPSARRALKEVEQAIRVARLRDSSIAVRNSKRAAWEQ